LLELQEELHKTIVFITHDLDEALRIGDRIAILRDGAVIQQGKPQEIVMRPADDYIFDFIKDINRGRVIEVKTIMTAGEKVKGPDLNHNVLLEEALQIVSDSETREGNVVSDEGEVIGSINLAKIVQALSRPNVEVGEETRYR
jgi:glycine betaine/proline transport system ATP-binding protein